MAKEIRTEIIIRSTMDKVWNILTDFTSYSRWNPFITSIKGNAELGERLRVKMCPPEMQPSVLNPTVISMVKNQKLSWLSRGDYPCLFEREHSIELNNNGNGTITLVQREKQRGLLAGLSNIRYTTVGFNMMNEKLKKVAEDAHVPARLMDLMWP